MAPLPHPFGAIVQRLARKTLTLETTVRIRVVPEFVFCLFFVFVSSFFLLLPLSTRTVREHSARHDGRRQLSWRHDPLVVLFVSSAGASGSSRRPTGPAASLGSARLSYLTAPLFCCRRAASGATPPHPVHTHITSHRAATLHSRATNQPQVEGERSETIAADRGCS